MKKNQNAEENLRRLKVKNSFVSIGKILNFHGVKGEAKLGYTKNREEFLSQISSVYIKVDKITRNSRFRIYVLPRSVQ